MLLNLHLFHPFGNIRFERGIYTEWNIMISREVSVIIGKYLKMEPKRVPDYICS